MNRGLASKMNSYADAIQWQEHYEDGYDSIDEIVESINKEDAIEIVEDYIETMKRTYPKIAFGHFAGGFCTAERKEDKDQLWSDGKGKRFCCWPSCNACACEIEDGYGLLDKALEIIKGNSNGIKKE